MKLAEADSVKRIFVIHGSPTQVPCIPFFSGFFFKSARKKEGLPSCWLKPIA